MFKSCQLFSVLVLGGSLCCLPAQVARLTAPADRVSGPVEDSQLVTLKGNIHPLARADFDYGAFSAAAATGRMILVLRRSDEQDHALKQYLEDLQNPSSSSFHKWLTPEQYGSAFGISDHDLASVTTWLQTKGIKVERIPQARNLVEFSGTIEQVQNAFHTSIHSFSINGVLHLANATEPKIPVALAPVVAGVGPLNDFHPKPMLVRGPDGRFDPSTGQIVPDLTLSGNGGSYLFVDPADAAIIYDTPNKVLNPSYSGNSYDGTGVSIGIVGVSDLTSSDVANYRMAFLGESPGSVNMPTVIVDGNDPGLNGAGTEALLDNEIAGGIAPKAKLYFYTSADTDISSGLMNALFRALDDNTVSILSMSFSSCEAALGTSGNQLILEASEQAAAQGITFTVSSGDNGSAGCDDFDTQTQASHGFGVNGFASTPYTIAVGGTDFDVLSTSFATFVSNTTSGTAPYYPTALKYIPENPWNDSTTVNGAYSNDLPEKNPQGDGNIIAGSGGVSSVYSKPSFQSSLTPQDGFRDLPDVSFLAGNGLYNAAWVLCSDSETDGSSSQNYTECQTTNGQFTSNTVFGGVGGTSAAAPAFAGMLALLAQAHGSASDNYRLGQADDILYQLAQSKYSTVFHDVSTGNNSVACASGSPGCGSNGFLTGYNAGQKYDLATGLGSVDAAALVNNWTSAALSSTNTTLKINGSTGAYSGVHGQSLTLDVNVSPSSATGTVGIVDNANEVSGGVQNNGQIAISITGGMGSTTYNGLPGGSYAVWARYSGDTANSSSTSSPSIDVSITPEDSTTTLGVDAYDRTTGKPVSATNMPLGTYVFLDAQIEGKAEGANTEGNATGNVTFTDGIPTLSVAPVSAGNQASWPTLTGNLPVLTGGQHQLVASYSGDSSFKASIGTASVNVLQGPSRITVDSQDIPALTLNSSQSDYVYSTIYTELFNGVPPPSGTVSLMRNNTVVSSGSAGGGDGTATQWIIQGLTPIKASQLQPGLNTFTVQYGGDSNYAPSSSGPISIDAIAPGGGLALISPDTVSMNAGTSLTTTITLTPSGGYTGVIHWNCSVPTDLNLFVCIVPQTHVPLSGPVDTVLAIFASSSTPSGNFTVALKGNDGTTDGITISKNITAKVTAAPPALAVMNNGLLNVFAGSTTGNVSAFSIIPSDGLTGPVNLSCAVTTSISNPQNTPTCIVPASVTLNDASPVLSQVQIGTASSTTAGTYAVAITATSESNSAVASTGTVPLTVTASPSFSLSTSGIVNIFEGATSPNAATLTITPFNGFSGAVSVSCSVAAAFTAAGSAVPTCIVPSSLNLTSGSPATINVGVSTPAQNFGGLYLMTLSVVDLNSAELGLDATIDVLMGTQPSFTLNNSGAIQVARGATSGNTASISVTPQSGFTGNVNMTCSVSTGIVGAKDLPTCSFNPAAVNITSANAVTSTLTIATTAATSGAAIPVAKPFAWRAGIPVLAFVLLFGIRSRRRIGVRMVSSLVLILWIGGLGCGGGGGSGGGGGGGGGGTGGNSGTTPGAYSVQVTGTDAATGKITAQTTLPLTVN